MSHHLLYINYLSFEVDLDYQLEVVPANVKHRTLADGVCVSDGRVCGGIVSARCHDQRRLPIGAQDAILPYLVFSRSGKLSGEGAEVSKNKKGRALPPVPRYSS
jgi:hypothetical protein